MGVEVSVEVTVTANVKANHERIAGDFECDILGFLLRQNKTAWRGTAVFLECQAIRLACSECSVSSIDIPGFLASQV